MSTIAWRVKELAARRGWGARRLAEEAGLDQKTARNWERTAGSAGEARPGELDDVLAGRWSEQTDPGFDQVSGLRRLGPDMRH